MPRKLPWVQKDNALNKGISITTVVPKGPSRWKNTPDPNHRGASAAQEEGNDGRNQSLSTSPPPENPFEKSMLEGIHADDKYRMVEDEFLTVAHQFTVHLHTAEYNRREAEVKSRNADTIHSILRPIVGKMPNHIKRKIAANVAQSHVHKPVHGDLVGQRQAGAESSDSDDVIELPYVGTTLHGLMDSPGKGKAELSKTEFGWPATRAAAGYTAAARQSKAVYPQPSERPTSTPQLDLEQVTRLESSTEDETYSDDEDDLDKPTCR